MPDANSAAAGWMGFVMLHDIATRTVGELTGSASMRDTAALALSSCDARGVISDAPVERPSLDDVVEAPPRVMRKLTRAQYEEAIHAVFLASFVVALTLVVAAAFMPKEVVEVTG